MQLLLGPPTARVVRDLVAMCIAMQLLGHLAKLLGYPGDTVHGVVNVLMLLVLYPVLSTPRAWRAAAAILMHSPASSNAALAAKHSKVRFELRRLGDALAMQRAALLLSSGAFPGGDAAAAWMRALAAAEALPGDCVLVEVFAAEDAKTPPQSRRAAQWGPHARLPRNDVIMAPSAPNAAQPNRLLAVAVARILPRVDTSALLAGGEHALLPASASLALLEVPLLGWPGWFPTCGVSSYRAATLQAETAAYLVAQLGLHAALLPAPAGGTPAPFAALALSTRGAHPLSPSLGAPDPTHVVAVPPHLVGCGSLDAYARAALSRSARADLLSKRRAFAKAGGTVAVVQPEALAKDPELLSMLSGTMERVTADDAQLVTTSPQDGGPQAPLATLRSLLSPPPPLAAPPPMLQLLASPCAFALAARVGGGGELLGCALALLDSRSRTLCVHLVALRQPRARASGASAALYRGALELALVHGCVAVDLGTHGAGGAAHRLGAAVLPRTPFLLFADDRLAAVKPHPRALFQGLLTHAQQLPRAAVAAAPSGDAPPSLNQLKRLRRRQIRAGAAAERARERKWEESVAAEPEEEEASFRDADTSAALSSLADEEDDRSVGASSDAHVSYTHT